ncbi:SHOCT domain-containing protein [Propioniciclava coleopterorum]|uniref:SHOCT domain-containing protein n=1 Tax=Propioniciclava coleopterorum TaxID=2714937 RepID=A0A6G7Y5N5_9ACTN|nr:SHOCT domain-containing protein [Propioniciclava coleopterorum]QIK72204.1 SHOCT domain-containing protein [Propioniciclava coleopterorum]
MFRPRRRGPGLIGTAARTAVIAGTATRVSGNVAAKQQAQAQQAALADQARVQQAAAAQVAAAQPAAPVPAPQGGDTLGDLERLAALHQQGALTDGEFAAAKARLLGL